MRGKIKLRECAFLSQNKYMGELVYQSAQIKLRERAFLLISQPRNKIMLIQFDLGGCVFRFTGPWKAPDQLRSRVKVTNYI